MRHLVVFVNKVDVAHPELVALVELETAELCQKHGFDGIAMVRGSALRAAQGGEMACIEELMEALDRVPLAERDLDSPFFMPIEGVCTIPGRGTVITGKVDRGRLAIGARVEIVGKRVDGAAAFEAVVTGIQEFHADVAEAMAGHNVGLLLRGVGRGEVERGQVAVIPGSIAAHREGEAEIVLLSHAEGGRKTPVGAGYAPVIFFGTTSVTATLAGGKAYSQLAIGPA